LSLEPSTHKHAIYPTLCPSCQSNLRNKEVSWYCHCIKVFIILKHLLLHPSNGSHDTSCLSSNGVLWCFVTTSLQGSSWRHII
jgi:hypothetical protein